jgi:nucleoside-diphosphate-sugar epimerase
MRILVIGGTQFMGPHVVTGLLSAGHEATLLHRGDHEQPGDKGHSDGPHIHGDRRDPEVVAAAVAESSPEVVVDMVAMLETDAANLVDAARGGVRRIVLASSIDVYRAYGRLHGKEPGPVEPVPLREDSPLREKLYPYRSEPRRQPGDPLAWQDDYDKIPVEKAVLGAPEIEGVVLRLPMVHGPEDRQHRLWPYLKRMLDGRTAIPLGETQSRWRTSRGYVTNVADAIVLAALHDDAAGNVYNVAEQTDEDEAAWVRAIGHACDWPGDVVAVPDDALEGMLSAQSARHHLYASSVRIRSELGYHEAVNREAALAATIAWEREHPPDKWPASMFNYGAEDEVLSVATE